MIPLAILRGGEGPIALFDLARSLVPVQLSGRVIVVPAMTLPAFRRHPHLAIDRGNTPSVNFNPKFHKRNQMDSHDFTREIPAHPLIHPGSSRTYLIARRWKVKARWSVPSGPSTIAG